MLSRFIETIFTMVSWLERLKESATAPLEPAHDSATTVLKLPGADRCPPIVKIQMIIHYIKRFNDDHLASRKKKIECVLNRMDRLNVERFRADVALQYERNELKKLKKYLVLRGMGTRNAHTQTPSPSVRFAKPVNDVKRTGERPADANVRTIAVPKTIRRAYVCSRLLCAAVARLLKWTAVYLKEPALLRRIAEKIAGWSANLFDVNVRMYAANRTSISLHVLPNVPRRSASRERRRAETNERVLFDRFVVLQ